jgi:hypothetical protein
MERPWREDLGEGSPSLRKKGSPLQTSPLPRTFPTGMPLFFGIPVGKVFVFEVVGGFFE